MKLRQYQSDCIDALYEYMATQSGNPIACLPTGSGKSVVIAELARRAIAEYPETRILILAHQKELLEQNAAKILAVWGNDCPIGIYSAGLGSKNLRAQVLVAGIQSIYAKGYHLQTPKAPDLVLIDECHLLSPKGDTMYRRLLGDLKQINPYLRVLGFSASPWRLDSGPLTGGESPIFHDIAFEIGILELIEKGYLCPLISKATATRFDTSGVAVSGGDFVIGQLQTAVDIDATTQAAVSEIVEFGKDRVSWLAFCTGVEHAYHVRDAIRGRGFTCETVTGDTPRQEREAILRQFKRGEIRALTNANVLTTGVDIPSIDLLAFLRPTKSSGLLLQMAGRAMRLSPETGKQNALVLDFARLIQTLGPIDQLRPKDKRKKGESSAPVKDCPECKESIYAAARVCPCCGFEFPPFEEKPKFESTASLLNVMSNEAPSAPIEPEWVDVTHAYYRKHEKEGKPPSVCVTYMCGLSSHRIWCCFSHQGFARSKAVAWWRQMTKQNNVPGSTDEALAQQSLICKPAQIAIRPAGRYFDVVGYRFADEIGA